MTDQLVPVYRLRKDMPGEKAGALFELRVWDPSAPDCGNRGAGCLVLRWTFSGNVQSRFGGSAIFLPGQLVDDEDWFHFVEYFSPNTWFEERRWHDDYKEIKKRFRAVNQALKGYDR